MPWTGPVPYHHSHSGLLIWSVISTGSVQVRPSSVLCCKKGLRWFMVSPGLYVLSREIRPDSRSTTGAGLPRVSPFPSISTWSGPQLWPPSVDRRITRSMSPSSAQLSTRPSANASNVPSSVRTAAGIRKHE